MDYVPSLAALAAAGQKSPHIDAVTPATNTVSPAVPTALDPRPAYALAPGTADAVLSLAGSRTQTADAVAFDTRYGYASRVAEVTTAAVAAPVVSPEPTKTVSAANRNWNEDVRLDHIPTRKIGTDTVVQYDNPRVMAAWRAAFPDVASRKYRGLTQADTNVKPDFERLKAESGLTFLEKDIYLLCSDDNFKAISKNHPDTHINWISVDSDDIVLFWPKDNGHSDVKLLSGPMQHPDQDDWGA
ncbi:hypothetical protein SAMN05216360_106174 [Methylobacterium phyllostachyos]|uniref:Uncharacterized protein n=1 Tax=Methylobacterium phyllostachyos TaxID=582672 RepID=A0A1G9ZA04_9HYPH|nr:hypothetical protein [Methylobacterium phyllostachyos]SDN17915.1 hypothetical protein SAMN05216360_106174 [Methylobacterium phyllostachyos]